MAYMAFGAAMPFLRALLEHMLSANTPSYARARASSPAAAGFEMSSKKDHLTSRDFTGPKSHRSL